MLISKLNYRQTAKKVDDNYHNNPYLIIDKGLPILKKLPKKKEHPDLDKIRKMIMDEMPIKSIVDVIVDVENWLNLSVHFKPISGYETKIYRLSTTICCNIILLWMQYGTNTNRTFSIKIYSQTNSVAFQPSCYRSEINKSDPSID